MIIQHNMAAMNANRQLNINRSRVAKSTEKLSSGYKINRAADDAAGLSMSEKMRRQIRGLRQASENIMDGISLCQVADGALNETADILQRMQELAVQSANGTNSDSDRQFIEAEIIQLKNEIDKIATTTTFNDDIYPLNTAAPQSSTPTTPANPGGNNNPSDIVLYELTVSFVTDKAFAHNGISYKKGDIATVTGMTTNGNEIRFDGGHVGKGGLYGPSYQFLDQSSKSTTFSVKTSDLQMDENGYVYFNSQATGTRWYYTYKQDGSVDPIACREGNMADYINNGYHYFTDSNLGGIMNPGGSMNPGATHSTHDVYVKAGASASTADRIQVPAVIATCRGLGIAGLTVATEKSSGRALDLLKKAVSKVSDYRITFGATQNRLEHAMEVDDNTAENTQAAESQIRDTDMAAEMVKHSIANILTQAGQSVLAQANQSNQGVLSMLV